MKLEEIFNQKRTENGDIAFTKINDDNLLNLLFLTEYYQNHLSEVQIGNTEKDQLFARFLCLTFTCFVFFVVANIQLYFEIEKYFYKKFFILCYFTPECPYPPPLSLVISRDSTCINSAFSYFLNTI